MPDSVTSDRDCIHSGHNGKYIQASLICCKDVYHALQGLGCPEKDDDLHLKVVVFRDEGQGDVSLRRTKNDNWNLAEHFNLQAKL